MAKPETVWIEAGQICPWCHHKVRAGRVHRISRRVAEKVFDDYVSHMSGPEYAFKR